MRQNDTLMELQKKKKEENKRLLFTDSLHCVVHMD